MIIRTRALLFAFVAILGVVMVALLASGVGPESVRGPRVIHNLDVEVPADRRGVVLVVAMGLLQSGLIAALLLQRRWRHRIEESLKESEEHMSLGTLPINLGLWRWDARTDEIWATEHLRRILQVPESSPLTRETMRVGIHPDDRALFDAAFTQSGNGEVLESDFRVLRPTGELQWVAGKARARRDPKGHIVRVTGVVIDITDRKRAEAECQNQRLQLAHITRVAILGQLSGALAHELTQPLTAILSNAQAAQRFLAAERVDLQEVREILDDIVNEDKRAGEVIRRVRALLKRGETQLQRIDVPQLIRDALAVTHSELIVRQVDVSCHVEPGLPPVRCDRVQIQQVLLNLLLNAAEAMVANECRERRIDIRAEFDDRAVRISIADLGTGIAEGQLDSVFDAFYTTKSNGLGLGLAICRSIVAAHGGRLWATNNIGRGSTFHFTLPVATEVDEDDRDRG